MKHTLLKSEILRQQDYFRAAFENGNRVYGKYIILIWLPFPKRLIGFTAARKCRLAVRRNYWKRRLREVYRVNKKMFDQEIVILHAKCAGKVKMQDLNSDLLNLLKKKRCDTEVTYHSH